MLAPEVIQRAEKRVGLTLCGKWHLDRVIGVGGMAAVYEATHRNRNRVAIKLLHPPLSLDEGTRHRFLREGYVANTIRHSGAVQVLDDDTTEDGVAFLVMELLRGESVEERMIRKGGALDPHEALGIADQLLDVLGAAHDQHVVHRDIKPDNIFLTEEGKIKVLDFGIARLHQGDTGATKVGSFMGTPAFCAPEQARGRWDEVDSRTDLFSVGASLFTCLTGTHVHEAETSSEQLALAISASARSLRSVIPSAPDDLVELVDQSLAYDKEERFQSARAMRAAVQRVRAGLPTGMVQRKISTPPPPFLAHFVGDQTEMEPDAFSLSSVPPKSAVRHVILGFLAASGVALLLFSFFSSRDGESSPTISASDPARVESPTVRKLPSKKSLAAPPTGENEKIEDDDTPPPPSDEPASAPKPVRENVPHVVPAAPAVPRQRPQPVSQPKAKGAEEDLFDKRF